VKIKELTALFKQFQDCVDTLQQALNVSPVSALTETFDNLEHDEIKVEAGAPDQQTVQLLSKKYQNLHYDQIALNDKAQVFTLLALHALSGEKVDGNLMPTPEILGTIIALMYQKMLQPGGQTIIDPAVGTGTLLSTVVSQLVQSNHSKNDFKLVGMDNNEDLLDLADVNFHLHHQPINLVFQDSLLPWMEEQPDVVISDLPVGYYPNDENAKAFATAAKTGHSFAHFLMIEQIIKMLKPGGFAFLVVPTLLFTGKNAADFVPWLADKVYLQALVELPKSLFNNNLVHKQLLVFQNHGGGAQPKQVLAAQLGSLKDQKSLVEFNLQLDRWKQQNQ
jgi:site-specific DNA-methyltransferase (adenine-specific)